MRIPYLHSFFEFISHNSFFGIPLDIIAHLFVGAFIAIFFINRTKNYLITFSFILFIALTKEYYDQNVMTNTLQENIKDIVVTLMPLLLLYLIHQLRFNRQIR